MEYIKIKNSSPAGDLIAMLAGVKQICKDQNKKAIIYQRINMIGIGYEGAEHPYKDEGGNPVTMNKITFEMLKPLLESQDYVKKYELYDGQDFEMDFDKVRLEHFTNQPKGSLARYLFHCYPQCATDLSKQWLHLKWDSNLALKNLKYKEKIIINITFRYRNYLMDYFFLKQFEKDLIFAGLPDEHQAFCKEFNLDIPLLIVKDFLELAMAIGYCKFFLGNASLCYWIAQAFKKPRILELFTLAPNVIPEGEHCFDYYHNDECRYYFNKLLNL